MGRWKLAVFILVPFLFTASYQAGPGGSIAEFENVVLIVVDTLAAQHLGFMGYERDTSPFLDELASRSVVFTRAYTPKSTTLPAFTSLLSACHPTRHGILENGVNLPPDIRFLTDDFRNAGFVTWGIPAARVLGAQYGLNRGFDYYANTPAIPHTAGEVNERVARILNGSPRLGEPSFTETPQPLFLMVHYYDPHTPFTPDENILSAFGTPAYCGIVDGTWEQFNEFNNHGLEFDDEDLERVRYLYDAEIRTLDDRLRELFGLLEQSGLVDNSLIVLTADHGENLGEHHFITHGHPYEKSLHIPLMFHFPGDRSGGTRIDSLVELTDVLPTLLDFMDIEIPDNVDGASLGSLMEPGSEIPYFESEYLYAIGHPTDHGQTCSVFDGNHRLIVDFGSYGNIDLDNGVFLYDIAADPEETRNLLDESRGIVENLAPVLARMVMESHEGHSLEVNSQTREMLAGLGYI